MLTFRKWECCFTAVFHRGQAATRPTTTSWCGVSPLECSGVPPLRKLDSHSVYVRAEHSPTLSMKGMSVI